MNIRLLFVALLVCVLAAWAFPQKLTSQQQAESDRVLAKIREMELYNQILPVLMTSDQVKAFLPVLEKHRADAERFESDEHRMLLGLEKELDKAIANAKEKGLLPGSLIMRDANVHFQAFTMRRKALIDDTVSKLKEVMREKLNEGQVRAAAHAFSPAVFGLDVKEEELTEDKRLDYWVRAVLMDNVAYRILVELSKK
jgi:hypothetical protein